MQLSIIIVNYNVRPFLESSLISVRKAMKGIDGEVIVVDNASDDGSVEMARQKFPDVKLIANDRNVGFGAANNQAMHIAQGKYFLLLNPDTVVQEDTFRAMVDFFESHDDAGIAGCKVLNPDGTLQLACRRSFPTPWVAFTKIIGLSTLFPNSRLFARYNLAYLNPDETHEVDSISGSFMFVRRTIFEKVGGFDERFFMYGEDLDWCYRIQQAGWKVYYVPHTQIIHYKGESARRSEIDEVKHFYLAMRVFVQKHFRRNPLTDLMLSIGIAIREWVAFIVKTSQPLRAAVLDVLLVNLSLFIGEYIRFGEVFRFPAYAYPVTLTVPALVIVATMYVLGVYTTRKLSISRAVESVVIGYVILSATTFFFNQYAFSRMVILISGAVNLFVLPGWRLAARAMFRSPEHHRHSLFGRRTIIVGADTSGQEVLRKLRTRIDDGYEVVGFVDLTRKHVGEKVSGVEILGSIDNIGKVIQQHRASEVIISTDILSYADILSVIARTRNRSVNFRLVPSSLEVIIGKTHIDELDDIPLVEIEYNIHKVSNRILKRLVDLVVSTIFLVTIFPIVWLRRQTGFRLERAGSKLVLLPKVFLGEMSLVGPPEFSEQLSRDGSATTSSFWGKPGLTGLVQVNYHDDLSTTEVEKYNLYYAKNQSFILDIEILLKSLLIIFKGKG